MLKVGIGSPISLATMSTAALKYCPQELLTAVIQERLDAVEDQAQVLWQRESAWSRQLLELQTLGSLAAALSGFLGELDGELDLEAWVGIQSRASRVIDLALQASRGVLQRARTRGAPQATLSKVLGSAEAVRVLREDLILASVRGT